MELFSEPFDLLLGRKTYEIFSAIWPFNTDNPIGAAIDRAHKYVLTGGNYPLDWAKSHRLRGIDEVRALKESDGPDLLIQGSAALYPQLLSANLSDELSILTFPVVCWGRASACSVRARRPAP